MDTLTRQECFDLIARWQTVALSNWYEPPVKRLEDAFATITLSNRLITKEDALARASKIELDDVGLSPPLMEVFPELADAVQAAIDRIEDDSNDQGKANEWLAAIAKVSGVDTTVEAAIYCKSRGIPIAPFLIRDQWHERLAVRARRYDLQTITLADVKYPGPLPSLAAIHEKLAREHDMQDVLRYGRFDAVFTDSTFCRAVEWLELGEFQPWVDACMRDLNEGAAEINDPIYASWWLFYWCRCDMALQKANPVGLRSWVNAIRFYAGQNDSPWQLNRELTPRPEAHSQSIVIAAALLFAAARIPDCLPQTIADMARKYLVNSQLPDGSWPAYAGDDQGSPTATCIAIHALIGSSEASLSRAKEWLTALRGPFGTWEVTSSCDVCFTVLALDSVAICDGEFNQLTFSPVIETYTGKAADLNVPQTTSPRLSENIVIPQCATDLLIVSVTDSEWDAIKSRFTAHGNPPSPTIIAGRVYHDLGKVGSRRIMHVQIQSGSSTPGGSLQVVTESISHLLPKEVIAVGIAFGIPGENVDIADVLISTRLFPYEIARIGEDGTIPRASTPDASLKLLQLLRVAASQNDTFRTHFGQFLSGEKLIDNEEFRTGLLKYAPEAIGGDMEAHGIYVACEARKVDWLIIKGVSDWADGKKHIDKESRQAKAASNAVELLIRGLQLDSS